MLDKVVVRGKAHRNGFDPELFSWRSDADDNGCDTRNNVLRRDLKNLVIEAGAKGCVVTAGELHDEYLGESYAFERGSAKVEIDHIVSPSNAWQTGAESLSEDQLQEFANDPLNLLAVSSNLKRQKGEVDAAAWLPPNEDYQCEYVSRQIAVKHKYGLWVAAAEKATMEGVLEKCSDQPAFAEDVAWPEPGEGDSVTTESAAKESSQESSEEPAEEVSPSPTEKNPGFSTGDSSADDQNCTADRDSEAPTDRRGGPGNESYPDRDGVGAGCE